MQKHAIQPDADPPRQASFGLHQMLAAIGQRCRLRNLQVAVQIDHRRRNGHRKVDEWLLTGTVHGRYNQTFQFTSNTNATYKSTINWTGGSGAYRSVKGTGTERCATTDGGSTQTCQSVAELTGL